VARTTVFGAGAMGTAMAMHLARNGSETVLWASEYDRGVLRSLLDHRKHPGLPEYLPASLSVMGPDALSRAGDGVEVAIMGAHSGGARTLARLVTEGSESLPLVVGIAKGLEPETGRRMSEVYSEEVGHGRVVSVGGPALAPEVAQGLPTGAVFGALEPGAADEAASVFRSETFRAHVTDDLAGLEYCTLAKNVAAIGMGILDGMGKLTGVGYRNAKAALFTKGFDELVRFVVALGGRPETAGGLAGLGDALVTSLGGRNRLYGELLGEGVEPKAAQVQLEERGMTVEGVESTRDVERLAREARLELSFFSLLYRILFESEPAGRVLDCLRD
jgi:glycerol-3-phosphate dehydrogenase (NAD(P)+)